MSRFHVRWVRVTNKNTFLHKDRFDGEDYFFPPNKTVEIPDLAARHFFGWGVPEQEDESHLTEPLTRQGWNLPFSPRQQHQWGAESGRILLARFLIELAPETRGRGAERIPTSAPASST